MTTVAHGGAVAQAIFVLVVLLLGASGARAGDETSRTTRTLRLPAKAVVEVEATIGEISISGWDRPDLFIELVRHAPSTADLERIRVAIEEGVGRARVRVVQADDRNDPALWSDITIKTPVTTVFESVKLFEGRIELTNLRGAVTADLRRGSIEASDIAGAIRLESGIGDVVCKRAELTPEGVLRLRAFNGNVDLQLARMPADARILALSFNGTITSTIPLTLRTRFGPRFGEATLGRGEPVISIDVVNGNISIRAPGKAK
ncbi:MAG: hypothetical protein HYX76_02660 [Acidobacteria bacterium]|nr:hypothetical protein [Acidobacteriota bacterium]